MKKVNIATLRGNLSKLLEYVEKGHEIEIQRRNVSLATIIPIKKKKRNKTKLGSGLKTVKVLSDLTDPLISADDWEMQLKD